MGATNILLALQIITDLTLTVQKVLNVVKTAQMEGRDVTPEELTQAKEFARSSMDDLKETLDN